jgi:diadenosine tetraphosphate (Ap4A) HIT family hydrolase
MFDLDDKLKQDSFFIGNLNISQLRLMNNSLYIWLILIPKINNVAELVDLSYSERIELMDEIAQISNCIKQVFNPYKLNIANLGNVVRQLHVHIIARNKGDPTWPDPVWGKDKPQELYVDDMHKLIIDKLTIELTKLSNFSL